MIQTTNEPMDMALVFIGGLALGTVFFGGLWFTVRNTVRSTKPALTILASFFIRMAIALAGFYYLGSGNWQRLLLALLGFIIARLAIVHFTKAKKEIEYET